MRGSYLALTLVLAVAGCNLLAPSQRRTGGAGDANAIRIGVVGSFSGTSAENGQSSQNGAQLAVDRVNEAGGVLGRQLKLEARDDKSDLKEAPAAASALYDAGITAVIGTNASASTQEVLLKAARPKGALLISPSATSPALTDPAQVDHGGWFFRTVPNDVLQGSVLAKMARAAGHKRLGVIYVDGPYGLGFARRLEQVFTAEGGSVTLVSYEETANPKSSYKDVIDKAFANQPDAIVLIAYPGEASVMINDWQLSQHSKTVAWYFGDGLQADSFVTNVQNKAALEGRVGTAPFTHPDFIALYERKYGKKPQYDAGGSFDAVMLLALAIEAAGSENAMAVRDQLRAVSAGGEKFGPDQIKAALEALRAKKDVDYEGYGGPIDFDARGDVASGNYDVWKVQGGKIVATGEVRKP